MATDNDFEDLVDAPDFAGEDDGKPSDPPASAENTAPEKPKDGEGEGEGLDDGNKAEGKEKAPKNEALEGGEEGDEPKEPKDGKKDQTMVPKAALDSTKRRLRETAARLKAVEDRFAVQDAEAARAAIPNRETQPLAYAEHLVQQAAAVQANDRLNMSEFNARERHGDDIVNEAFDWANAQMVGPEGEKFKVALLTHASPYDFAVKLHKEAQEAQQGGGASKAANDDPEYAAFLAWKASQGEGNGAQPQTPATPAKRPTSLAQTPSASGPSAPDGVVDPFAAEFDR